MSLEIVNSSLWYADNIVPTVQVLSDKVDQIAFEHQLEISTNKTRHRASTSMYSLTFCICVMLPECHQWKHAVQPAVVMLRMPPVDGQPATPISHIRRAILRTSPVARQSPASSARRTRPDGRSHYVVISRDGRKLVTRVRVMLP